MQNNAKKTTITIVSWLEAILERRIKDERKRRVGKKKEKKAHSHRLSIQRYSRGNIYGFLKYISALE
jgi:hypothetical protein